MTHLTRLLLGLAAVLGTACGTVAAPVAIAQSLGSRQCEGGGSTPQALAQTLRAAGLTVLSESCAHDGRMRPAVCGAPDGRLAVFEVPGEQLARAQALGFVALSTLPDARPQPCPPAR
jgi:hypothetical protein